MRYGHVTRPTELALVCPRCGALARAAQPARERYWSIGDCWPEWTEPWSIVCTGCHWRAADLTWDGVRQSAPLYFATAVGGVDLWAWNRQHLELLVHVLEGGDPAAHPLGYFATYLHKPWLRKTRREAFARAARRLLER